MPLGHVSSHGPQRAQIMILLPSADRETVSLGQFSPTSTLNTLLLRMLNDAGILYSDCRIEYCAPWYENNPMDLFIQYTSQQIPTPTLTNEITRIWQAIDDCQPNIVIACGEMPTWILTGNKGIRNWRGSILQRYTPAGYAFKCLPVYEPFSILSEWSFRYITVHDLRRVPFECDSNTVVPPNYNFILRPDFVTALATIRSLRNGDYKRIACDIETRHGHIACVGFAWSRLDAICIPLMCVERIEGYWTSSEEVELIWEMCELFRTPGIEWIFQNGIYDLQYFARHWGCIPPVHLDTMLAHHVCWAGLPKGLDFLSSMYCEFHQYWKSEGKLWDPRTTKEDDLWKYNCKDAVITFEVSEALDRTIDTLGLREPVNFQMRQFPAVLHMMLRGVKQNVSLKNKLNMELLEAELSTHQWLHEVLGFELNPKSPKQMKEFFYGELGLPPQKNRKTKKVSCDEDALQRLAIREPIIRPVVRRILELRTLGVFRSTFIAMRLDADGRIRCSYNIAGTETFRYSSSEDAFGLGGNLQNIPSGDEAEGLPNVRKLFVPDEGFILVDCDLAGADAQVVAWEADDPILKQMFREKANVHLENAKTIFHNPRLTVESRERQLAKIGVHATNYGAKPPTLARALGITIHEAERFQRNWFAAHPGIAEWHQRVADSLATTRTVSNRFGFRRYYFDRIEGILPEALAWIPQSTVALVIDNGLVNIHETLPEVQNLLQVHDSIVFQCKANSLPALKPKIQAALSVPIPYDDPLTISVGAKASTLSWGHCEKISW